MFSSESPQYLRQGLSMFGQSLLLNVSEFVFSYRRKNKLFCSRNKVFVYHGYVVVTTSQNDCMNILFLNHYFEVIVWRQTLLDYYQPGTLYVNALNVFMTLRLFL